MRVVVAMLPCAPLSIFQEARTDGGVCRKGAGGHPVMLASDTDLVLALGRRVGIRLSLSPTLC